MEAIEVSHLTFSYDGENDILKRCFFFNPKRKLYNDYWT